MKTSEQQKHGAFAGYLTVAEATTQIVGHTHHLTLAAIRTGRLTAQTTRYGYAIRQADLDVYLASRATTREQTTKDREARAARRGRPTNATYDGRTVPTEDDIPRAPGEALLTLKEATTRCSRSINTLRKAACSGELAAWRIPDGWRVTETALNAYLYNPSPSNTKSW